MRLALYMLRRFFAIFVASMFFVTLILILTDLLMNIWGYISNEAEPSLIARIILYYIPKSLWYSLPISVLFATAYMLSDFYANNELLALFASGISIFRFAFPLLIISVFMSVAMFFLDDRLVTRTYAEKTRLQAVALHKEKDFDRKDIVVISEGGKMIYKAEFFDSKNDRLFALFVLYRGNGRGFEGLLYANSAEWSYDHWKLSGSCFYRKEREGYSAGDADYDHLFRLTEPPESFRSSTINVDEVSVAESRDYIRRLEKAGLPSSDAKAVYYKKFSFPMVVVVVVLLAVALSGKTRKNVLLVSLGLCISAVVLFYVMQMMTMLMARFGTVPPAFGGWFPVIFFIFLSAVLLRYTRT
ncbi:MAG: LptF/LptG family permease [Treponema sp.]|nr:LptF/LptG family permease [Treponema sp.]